MNMKQELILKKVGVLFNTTIGVRFLGDDIGFKPQYTIWVSRELVNEVRNKYYIELPIKNVDVARGRGGLILRPGHLNLFNVRVIHGMYGTWDAAKLDIVTSGELYSYYDWPGHEAALVLTSEPRVKYRWKIFRWENGKEIMRRGYGVVELDGTVREKETGGSK
jgi:hypothetical protein